MVKKLTTIYIARHGESEGNVKKILQGQLDLALTSRGKQQAKLLSKNLSKTSFSAVFSSDLIRARTTATILALERKIAVETSKLLRERSFGKLEGNKEDVRKLIRKLDSLSYKKWLRFKLFDDMETSEEAIGRFITFIREIAIAYTEKNILIISHASIMRAFLIHLGFAKPSHLPSGSIPNAAYFVLETDGIDFFIKETHNIKLPA